jgi:threonine dehydrogenase-like Zn-dependent dehydrogenase
MARRLLFMGQRKLGFEDFELPPVGRNLMKVKTVISGISHGTELSVFRGSNRLFSGGAYTVGWTWRKKLTEGYAYPLEFGYDQVAEVQEVGDDVRDFEEGDMISSAYGHKDEAVIDTYNLVKVPHGVSAEEASFRALGCVALSGLHKAGINLGDTVAVFGLGAIGLITVQLVKMSGAGRILAVGRRADRLRMAEQFGAEVIDAERTNASREIRALTGGHGADVSIEVSGSLAALGEAVKSTAYRGKVLVLGLYDNPAQDVLLGSEFHYNELQLIQSQGEGLPPDPFRLWDVRRFRATFLEMIRKGSVRVKDLVSHRFKFEDAEKAFRLIDERKEPVLRVVLTFGGDSAG